MAKQDLDTSDSEPLTPSSTLCPVNRSWWADVFVTGIVLVSLVIFIKLSVTVMRERQSMRNRTGDPGTCRIVLWAVMFLTGLIVLITVYMFNTEEFEDAVLE